MVCRLVVPWIAAALLVTASGSASHAAGRGDDEDGEFLDEDAEKPRSGRRSRAVDEAVEEKSYDLDEVGDGKPSGRSDGGDDNDDDDDDDGDGDDSAAAADAVQGGAVHWPSLLAPAGKYYLWVMLEVALNAKKAVAATNTSIGGAGKPTAIAPDGWYGFREHWSFGVVHSEYGQTGFWGGQGDGLCFTGKGSGCASFYSRFGFLTRYRLYREGPTEIAFDGGLLVRRTDPFAVALKAGLVGRYLISGETFLEGGASLLLGVTKRAVGGVPINKELLSLPISLQHAINDEVVLFGQSGLSAFLEDLGDTVRVPLSLGALYNFNESWAASGILSFPGLLSGSGNPFGGFSGRTLTFAILYRD